ncbi:MAG: NADH-quinone oxidoreductase subunit C [Myxococcota bacterium]|jgi:Ni,Fe-hydrogenase III large subunit|nr:NADH-quinone oxidoreductase subunit C [Myxococcota bacterium]
MAVTNNSAACAPAQANNLAHKHILETSNGLAVPMSKLPVVSIDLFRSTVLAACKSGARLTSLLSLPAESVQCHGETLLAVLADDKGGTLGLIGGELPASREYQSLTQEYTAAQAFERELYELHGIVPLDHPWCKPLRRHSDLERTSNSRDGRAAPEHPFYRIEGDGIHEVAVGPVHAGVIEPGHFRFQCFGETVLSLEIQLGYQHRGAEALLLSSTPARRLVVAETIAGETAIGHGLAHCIALEGLGGAEPSLYAETLRGVALGLERCANHIGDLGALCNDVGFLPGGSWFGRLRGEYLNLSLDLCGNRFGHGFLKVGGIRFGLSAAQRKDFLVRLAKAAKDVKSIAELTFDTPSIGARFERTGIVSRELAEELGLVGPAARASGCDRDVRRDHPCGLYRFAHIPVATIESGDVMARALVRWLETERSSRFMCEQIEQLQEDKLAVEVPSPRPSHLVVSLVEAWRGEVVHVAATDATGKLAVYKVTDPSLHNWFGLAMSLRGNQISDFPLCNKSFNLSYAGHDL